MGAYEAALVYSLTLFTTGNGSGVITPTTGIHAYFEGTVADLSAEVDDGMVFTGWSGSSGCGSQVTMNADKACTAGFNHAIIYVKQDAPGPVHDGFTWETVRPGACKRRWIGPTLTPARFMKSGWSRAPTTPTKAAAT